ALDVREEKRNNAARKFGHRVTRPFPTPLPEDESPAPGLPRQTATRLRDSRRALYATSVFLTRNERKISEAHAPSVVRPHRRATLSRARSTRADQPMPARRAWDCPAERITRGVAAVRRGRRRARASAEPSSSSSSRAISSGGRAAPAQDRRLCACPISSAASTPGRLNDSARLQE